MSAPAASRSTGSRVVSARKSVADVLLKASGRPVVLAAMMVFAGLSLTRKPVRLVEAAGGVALLVIAAIEPSLLLLGSPAYAYLGVQYVPGIVLLAYPMLTLGYVGIGTLTGRRRVYPMLFGLLTLFAVWMIGSYLYGQMLGSANSLAGGILVRFLIGLGYCAITASARLNRERLLMAIVVLGTMAAVLARTVQRAVVQSSAVKATDLRVHAAGYDPNAVGNMMSWGAVASLGLLVSRRKPIWLIPMAVCLSGLPATKSRASIVALAAGVIALVMLSRTTRTKVLFAVAAVALLVFVPNVSSTVERAVLQDRASHLSQRSDQIRRDVVVKSFEVGYDHLLMGVGLGRFNSIALADPQIGQALDPHNQYGQFLAEAGLPALLLFLTLVFLALRGPRRDPADIALAALLCAMLMALTTAPELLNLAQAIPVFMVLGSMIGTSYDRRHPELDAAEPEPIPVASGLSLSHA